MQRHFLGIRAHVDGAYRTETLFGKEFTVVPVVALVEGVIQGMTAEGPELALAEEFGRFVAGWNGRPVVMSHPVDSKGEPISANAPETLKDYQIGSIFNAKLTDKKLVLEAWVENTRAENLNANSKSTFSALKQGDMIEVSTGYFAQLEEITGEYGAEKYVAIQRNIVPDHLAFLPDGTIGACSNKDGCGAPRINQFMVHSLKLGCECGCGGTCGDHMSKPKANDQYATIEDYTELVIENGKMVRKKKNKNPAAYQNPRYPKNGESLDLSTFAVARELLVNSFPDGMMDYDAEQLIAAALRKTQSYSYVIGLTPSMVVYEQYDASNGYYKTYQRSYSVSQDGSVTLGTDVQEVMLTTRILPVANESKPGANAQSQPSEGSTPKENTESPNMADKPAETPGVKAQEDPNTPAKQPTVHKVSNDQGELEVTLNEKGEPTGFKLTPKAQAKPAEQPKAQTFDELLANASPTIRETMKSAMKLHTQHKTEIISALEKTGRCKFNKEQLQAMDMDMLENLASLAEVPSYSGQAIPAANAADDAPPQAPMCFEVVQGGKSEKTA